MTSSCQLTEKFMILKKLRENQKLPDQFEIIEKNNTL